MVTVYILRCILTHSMTLEYRSLSSMMNVDRLTLIVSVQSTGLDPADAHVVYHHTCR